MEDRGFATYSTFPDKLQMSRCRRVGVEFNLDGVFGDASEDVVNAELERVGDVVLEGYLFTRYEVEGGFVGSEEADVAGLIAVDEFEVVDAVILVVAEVVDAVGACRLGGIPRLYDLVFREGCLPG